MILLMLSNLFLCVCGCVSARQCVHMQSLVLFNLLISFLWQTAAGETQTNMQVQQHDRD